MAEPTSQRAFAERSEDPAENALRLASRYNDVQRCELAEREALRGLAAAPENADLQFELARSLFGRQQWRRADKAAERLLALAPEWPAALNLMCLLRAQQGSYGEAERLILDALRIAPESAALYETYGDLMRKTGHEAKAVRLYERARAIDPTDVDVHAKLALVESSRRRAGVAEKHARSGLACDPEESLAHAALGTAMLQRGRPYAARRHLREALRLEPGNESYEEAWLEADRYCRLVYLPMYYWCLLLSRIPGKQFMVWGIVMVLVALAGSLGVPPGVTGTFMLAYIAFCLYTWLASLILRLWLRLRPPNLDIEEA
ncbi:MAG TPA: tetratricopeptide repeat protein [Planctomycetota bacterium]|nr:tetratricopeptide repeat protein [Planctomycetota bacterium]